MAIYGLPDERLELILERYPKKIKEIREQVKKTLKEVNGKGELLDKEYSRVKFDFLKPNSLITLDLDLIEVSEKEKNAIQDELKLIHKRIIKLRLTRKKIINANRKKKNHTLLNFFLKLINN